MRKVAYLATALVLLISVGACVPVFATELEGTDPGPTDQSSIETTDPSIDVTEDYVSDPTDPTSVNQPDDVELDDETVEVTKPHGVYDEVPVDIGPEPSEQRDPEVTKPVGDATKPIPNNWQLAYEAVTAGASNAAYWMQSQYYSAVSTCNQYPLACGAPVAIFATAVAVATSPAWAF